MQNHHQVSRRESLMSFGAMGAALLASTSPGQAAEASETNQSGEGLINGSDAYRQISKRVHDTSFVDTHEHLFEESVRLSPNTNPLYQNDDWALLISSYLFSDLVTAGLLKSDPQGSIRNQLFEPGGDPIKKWNLIQPYWPAVRNTGYGMAVRLSLKTLYGVDDLSSQTIAKVQTGYEQTRAAGFYRKILRDVANIESCQVNSLWEPFVESEQPTLMMQDLNGLAFLATPRSGPLPGWTNEACQKPTGISVTQLADWHRVIDWWFAKYGRYAVAVKSQLAYNRDIDHVPVSPEEAEQPFQKILASEVLSPDEMKKVEDHLFWYTAEKAIEFDLPYKLHTGYYAGENRMPLSRLINNANSACDLCRTKPDATFVFMHICYPYYEEILSVAKQYTNAYIDMCWAWIINPIAAKDFLKKYLVTAPANKVLTFGADYLFVENVVGHAAMARHGITQALSELVDEGWLTLDDALDLVEPIMRGNARQLFRLDEKEKQLAQAPWA